MSHVHKTYIGIDPGKKGAVAVITDGHLCDMLSLVKLNTIDLFKFIEGHRADRTFITIEKAHARPLDGRRSIFSFGKSYGQALAVSEIVLGEALYKKEEEHTVGLIVVPSSIWKKTALGKGKHDKQDSINKVKEIYPDVNLKRTPRCTVDDDNIAEAILIALYGYKFWEGSQW